MIFKRGKSKGKQVYYIQFTIAGKVITRSARTSDKRLAGKRETALHAQLLNGNFGILERKAPAPSIPTVGDFARTRFLSWAEATFREKPKTWLFYRDGIRRILSCTSLASTRLDRLTSENIASYVAYRQSCEIGPDSRKKRLEVSSINRELQVLRRLLRLAVKWGVVGETPEVALLKGERHREFVLQPAEEAKYLAAASEPLASVATVLADSGLRPEEAYRLRWEFVTWVNGRHGSFRVTHGKTKAARRILPMTPRVRAVLENRWKAAGEPFEGWVWPAPTKSGHIEPSTLRKQHRKAIRLSGVRSFVLYSLRHTFLTRLGTSGRVDVWTLARVAGHSDIKMSSRYVHPDDENVLAALEKAQIEASTTDKSTNTNTALTLSA